MGTNYTVTAEMRNALQQILDSVAIRKAWNIDAYQHQSVRNVINRCPSKSDLEVCFGILAKHGITHTGEREVIRF